MHTPKANEEQNPQLTKHDSFLLVLFLSSVVRVEGQEAWEMLLRTAPRRKTSRLEQY